MNGLAVKKRQLRRVGRAPTQEEAVRQLLASLRSDLGPVGTVEELLVEKIAQEYWRLGVAAWHEAKALSRENAFQRPSPSTIVRYQTTINRQFFQAMNQLERLQRLRKGDHVPAPLNLQVLGQPPTMSEQWRRRPLQEWELVCLVGNNEAALRNSPRQIALRTIVD